MLVAKRPRTASDLLRVVSAIWRPSPLLTDPEIVLYAVAETTDGLVGLLRFYTLYVCYKCYLSSSRGSYLAWNVEVAKARRCSPRWSAFADAPPSLGVEQLAHVGA